ncbi:MAG: hypothetical protein LKG27_03880 [Clostridiaceae bacterium]|jgi:hypothetical protein|nr:hypothetical protein [Clostridiaceae bacterium]
MVQISIEQNQGITQALKKAVGGKVKSNISAADWQQAINMAQEGKEKSIFKSSDKDKNTNMSDVKDWHQNFVVDKQTIEIDQGVFDKIKELLTGGNSSAKTQNTDNPIDGGELPEVVVTGQNKSKLPSIASTVEPPKLPDKLNLHIDINSNQLTATDGKILERSVNGKKQNIEITQDKDGNKVRYAVNENGSRGEQLVEVSSAGKNKYLTKSQYDKQINELKAQINPSGPWPSDIKIELIDIGNGPQPIFKKNGKTVSSSDLAQAIKTTNQNQYVDSNVKPKVNSENGSIPSVDDKYDMA